LLTLVANFFRGFKVQSLTLFFLTFVPNIFLEDLKSNFKHYFFLKFVTNIFLEDLKSNLLTFFFITFVTYVLIFKLNLFLSIYYMCYLYLKLRVFLERKVQPKSVEMG